MTLSKESPDIRVYLGPSDGTAVIPAAHRVHYLTPLEINWNAGGDDLDSAEFDYNLWYTGERIQNLTTPTGWTRQIEVRLYTGETFVPLFWGELTQQRLRVDRSEAVTVVASVFPYHFGNVISGPIVYDPATIDYVFLNEDIVFNPEIDGIIEGNMSSRTGLSGHHLFGDPESFRTTEAETFQGATVERWSLKEAVKAACWMCNPSETWVKNPTDLTVIGVDAPSPENLTLPWGKYLPEYLDALLHPHGYGWCLSLTAVDDAIERRITIFKRDDGPQFGLAMQPVGSLLELNTSEPSHTLCQAFNLNVDVGGLANQIVAKGSREQHEMTIELYRGWPEADDALTGADLAKDDKASDYHTADKTKVWRLWPANEAGDWSGTRETVAPIPAAPRDWSEYGVLVQRRREIEDCLTYGEDGKRRPPYLEWSDDDGATWNPAPQAWHYRVYQSQMAVEFTDDEPPAELMAAGDDARLRVTCTMTGDERITATADKRAETPNGRLVEMTLDVSDRYGYRQIVTTGDYASEINDGSADADTRDDTSQLQALVDYVRSNEESARMSGGFALIGLATDYWIGDLITNVNGREVSLNRNAAGATAKYLQITGVTWRPQELVTELRTAASEAAPFYQPAPDPV